MSVIRAGRCAGGLGSPPCSTWSRARHRPLPGGGGPRPLRTREEPFACIHDRSSRERSACIIGTDLALIVVYLLSLIAALGGWIALEHPADPGPPFPSLFATEPIADMCCLLRCVIVDFHQCLHGAPARKPTGLLTNDFSLARRVLVTHNGKCNHPQGHRAHIGINEAGQFLTTPLAAYPPRLCQCLAQCFADALRAGGGGPV